MLRKNSLLLLVFLFICVVVGKNSLVLAQEVSCESCTVGTYKCDWDDLKQCVGGSRSDCVTGWKKITNCSGKICSADKGTCVDKGSIGQACNVDGDCGTWCLTDDTLGQKYCTIDCGSTGCPNGYECIRKGAVTACFKSNNVGADGKINSAVNDIIGPKYNPSCKTSSGDTGIASAVGCIPVEVNKFIPWLLNILFGIAGGIAFLLMVYGFILIATSSGDEKKFAGGKETITSALTGLLVCIFAIFILRLIMVNILHIPGVN
jgi:hypothetical protein